MQEKSDKNTRELKIANKSHNPNEVTEQFAQASESKKQHLNETKNISQQDKQKHTSAAQKQCIDSQGLSL